MSSLCIYCYKPITSCHQSRSDRHVRFLQQVNRYFSRVNCPVSLKSHKNVFRMFQEETRCCTDCFSLVESYNELFERWTLFQLQLDGKIEKLRDVMRFAERIPSRVKSFRSQFDADPEKFTKLKENRDIFKTLCKNNYKMGYPLVSIPRLQLQDDTLHEVHDGVICSSESEARCSAALQYFLGWIFSLGVVTSLVTEKAEERRNCLRARELINDLETDWEPEVQENITSTSFSRSSFYMTNDHKKESHTESPNPEVDNDLTGIEIQDLNKPFTKLVLDSASVGVEDDDSISKNVEHLDQEKNSDDSTSTFDNVSLKCERREEEEDWKPPRQTPETSEHSSSDSSCDSDLSEDSSDLKPNLTQQLTLPNKQSRKRALSKPASICAKCNCSIEKGTLTHQAHKKYLHSNALGEMTRSEIKLLNLNWTSVKLKGMKFSKQSPEFRCSKDEFCSKMFVHLQDLEKHEKLHQPFNCNFCDDPTGKELPALELITHELQHAHETQKKLNSEFSPGEHFVCDRCQFSALFKGDFVNHYLTHHFHLPAIQSTCPICRLQCPFADQVPLEHYVNYHDLHRLEDPSSPVSCSVESCTAYFLTEDKLQQHWNTCHNNAGDDFQTEADVEAMRNLDRGRKLKRRYQKSSRAFYKCAHCPSKGFWSPVHLRFHEWRYHSQNEARSGPVGKIVVTPNGLTIDDLILDKRGKFQCPGDSCGVGFLEQEDFQRHLQLHGTFCCHFCPVSKSFAPELSIHELLHKLGGADRGTIHCPRCDFKTRKRDIYLDHHLQTHLNLTMDKKRCPICKHSYGLPTTASGTLKENCLKHFVACHDMEGVETPHNCEIKIKIKLY